jgi:hypothetical protein
MSNPKIKKAVQHLAERLFCIMLHNSIYSITT